MNVRTAVPESRVARTPARLSPADDATCALLEGDGIAAVLDGFEVEQHVGFLLRRAHQRHAAIFQSCMAEGAGEDELTPPQFAALVKVVEHGKVTQNQLGRLAAMDPATIQGVVRRLVARGLVARALDPMDRRTAVLTPTDAGVALAGRLVPCARRVAVQTLAPLTATECRTLLALLARMS